MLVDITLILRHPIPGHFVQSGEGQKFWARVRKTEHCWIWTGPINERNGGYGFVRFRGVSTGAHRVAFMLAHGEIPKGVSILHNCSPNRDNPRCVNPAHLRLGTQAENMKDGADKGAFHVPRPTRQKLSPADLKEVDRLLSEGELKTRIAEQFGVSKTWVTLYAKGKRRQYDRPSARAKAGAA